MVHGFKNYGISPFYHWVDQLCLWPFSIANGKKCQRAPHFGVIGNIHVTYISFTRANANYMVAGLENGPADFSACPSPWQAIGKWCDMVYQRGLLLFVKNTSLSGWKMGFVRFRDSLGNGGSSMTTNGMIIPFVSVLQIILNSSFFCFIKWSPGFRKGSYWCPDGFGLWSASVPWRSRRSCLE